MRRYEVIVWVDAPNLRAAKAALRGVISEGFGPAGYCMDLIDALAEVKPPKPARKAGA